MAAAGDVSTEVCVIPKNQHCGEVADIQKAELVPGGSLLGCLSVRGRLVLWDPADREALPAPVDGSFSDFCWEEAPQAPAGLARLLAVGAQGHLKLLEVEAERGSPVSLQSAWERPADQLLEVIREQDHDVVELRSLLVLSFAAGRCAVLLNADWLLQLQWRPAEAELQMTSCCRVGQSRGGGQTAVDHCFLRETLFILHTSGLITLHSASDGALLASVDVLAYLNSWLVEDEPTSASSSFSSSSFCLLQVSADLSTAVAVTRSHAAVAVDLNHYFRCFPDHLFCAVPTAHPPLQTQQADQDSVSSSSSSFISLGLDFNPDR